MGEDTSSKLRRFNVRGLNSDRFLGTIELQEAPLVSSTIRIGTTEYVIKELSVGRRLVDELYVI